MSRTLAVAWLGNTSGMNPRARTAIACPVCDAAESVQFRDGRAIGEDVRAAVAFWDGEVDLTQSDGVEVRRCPTCRSLWRADDRAGNGGDGEVVEEYRADRYGAAALDRLFERGTEEYEHDQHWMVGQGLRPGSRVLEIGSYAGAFLAFAQRQGCEAVGVDVNPEAAEYVRRRGLRVVESPYGARDFAASSFDSVWVLTCFEQLSDLAGTLDDVRRVLVPGGRLVVRTPNADFIQRAYRWPGLLRAPAMLNHVWGVPYRHCLSPDGAATLLTRHGFDSVDVRGREFATVDPPHAPRWWRAARPLRPALWRALGTHPWMDVAACA